MDTSTITLIAGLISCVIGVSSFVVGRMAKAEHTGSLEEKINQALDGIDEINRKLEDSSHEQHEMALLARSHEEKIVTLFRQCDDMRHLIEECNKTHDVLMEMARAIRKD